MVSCPQCSCETLGFRDLLERIRQQGGNDCKGDIGTPSPVSHFPDSKGWIHSSDIGSCHDVLRYQKPEAAALSTHAETSKTMSQNKPFPLKLIDYTGVLSQQCKVNPCCCVHPWHRTVVKTAMRNADLISHGLKIEFHTGKCHGGTIFLSSEIILSKLLHYTMYTVSLSPQ